MLDLKSLSSLNYYKNHHQEHLSDEKQNELIKKYQKGDEEAGQKLVRTNIGLPIHILNKNFNWENCEKDDLIQQAILGLQIALDKYDPDNKHNTKFTSYAAYVIRTHILRHIIRHEFDFKVSGRNERRLFYNLGKAKKDLKENGVEPTPKNIANWFQSKKGFDISAKEVKDYIKMSGNHPSLEESYTEDDDTPLKCIVSDDIDYEEVTIKYDKLKKFSKIVKSFKTDLDEREKDILENRILSDDPLILEELGNRWDVTRERIRQVEQKVQEKLENYIAENHSKFFMEMIHERADKTSQ